jgi:hypothetical protein
MMVRQTGWQRQPVGELSHEFGASADLAVLT